MERTILARFTFPEQADRAAQSLRHAGFDVVTVDTISDGDPHIQSPLVEWGRYGYQPTSLDDKWTSASAWDNPLGLTFGESILLTAVVPEEAAIRALTIIKEFGGIP